GYLHLAEIRNTLGSTVALVDDGGGYVGRCETRTGPFGRIRRPGADSDNGTSAASRVREFRGRSQRLCVAPTRHVQRRRARRGICPSGSWREARGGPKSRTAKLARPEIRRGMAARERSARKANAVGKQARAEAGRKARVPLGCACTEHI